MDLRELKLSEAELMSLSRAAETEGGAIIVAVMKKWAQRELEAAMANPRRSDELKHDIAYKLGMVNGIIGAAGLPEEADKLIRVLGERMKSNPRMG